MDRPQENKPSAEDGSGPITKGRFKVKHIKSDPSGAFIPQLLSRVSSAPEASAQQAPDPPTPVSTPVAEERDKQPSAAAPKKSRFIVKTKTPKEDDRADGGSEGAGTSSPALRSGAHSGSGTIPQAHGLVRVPSGTNISLLRQPSSQQPSRSGLLKEEHIDRIYQMLEANNRMLREMLGDHAAPGPPQETPPAAHHTPVWVSSADASGGPAGSAPSPDITAPVSAAGSVGAHMSQSAEVPPAQVQRATSTSAPAGVSATSGDKSMAKLSHHASEIKKEIENAAKARRDSNIEIQRLREKCQLLEDRVAAERGKVASLEERLEKSQMRQRNMAAQVEAMQQALAAGSGSGGVSGVAGTSAAFVVGISGQGDSAVQGQPASPPKQNKPMASGPSSGSVFDILVAPELGKSTWASVQPLQSVGLSDAVGSSTTHATTSFISGAAPQSQMRVSSNLAGTHQSHTALLGSSVGTYHGSSGVSSFGVSGGSVGTTSANTNINGSISKSGISGSGSSGNVGGLGGIPYPGQQQYSRSSS